MPTAFGGFLDVALGEQRGDRFFLLASEFAARSLYFPPIPTAWAVMRLT